jgi:hypothetical protein
VLAVPLINRASNAYRDSGPACGSIIDRSQYMPRSCIDGRCLRDRQLIAFVRKSQSIPRSQASLAGGVSVALKTRCDFRMIGTGRAKEPSSPYQVDSRPSAVTHTWIGAVGTSHQLPAWSLQSSGWVCLCVATTA